MTLASEYPQASFSFHKADVADWDQLAEVFEKVYNEQGRIDIVFANAGISREVSFILDEEKPSKPQLLTLEVNLIGTLNSMYRIYELWEILADSPCSRQAGNTLHQKE